MLSFNLFNRNARALEYAQMQWLGLAFKAPNRKLTQQVRSHLSAYQKFTVDGDILVTKVGFASVEIHADHTVAFKNCMVSPGVNHNGRQGFLVLDGRVSPFFSFASSAKEALLEAKPPQTSQKLRFSHV